MSRRPTYYAGLTAYHADNDRPTVAPPTKEHVKKLDQLDKAGFSYKKIRIRILSHSESHQVRSAFTQTKRDAFENKVRQNLREIIDVDFAHLSPAQRKEIFSERYKGMRDMQRHHIYPVALCPIDLAPADCQGKWTRTLEWWQEEAHKQIAIISPDRHKIIHEVIDRNVYVALQKKPHLTRNRQSGAFVGIIELPMHAGIFWDPMTPDNRTFGERFGHATPTRPILRLAANRGTSPTPGADKIG